jgi:AcrR family transcriptional regulator
MRTRKDGEETRRRILLAARRVFAEAGFRDATLAEICRLAEANCAAVNYHFGSKEQLYRAAWEHIALEVDRTYPLDLGVADGAPAENRLAALIRSLLQRLSDEKLGAFHRLLMMELTNPTGILTESMERRLETTRSYAMRILSELLGPAATPQAVERCEMSVISQCRIIFPAFSGRAPCPWHFCSADLEAWVEHITRFSLAGIAAVRQSAAGAAP